MLVAFPQVKPRAEAPTSEQSAISREAALALAERCAALLKERFGVSRVIPFGSVVGDGPWRPDSDLDLAVEGLPPGQFFTAWGALEELLSRRVALDLVDLTNAPPELRARVLGETPMADDPVLQLRGVVEDELTSLGRIVASLAEAVAELSAPPRQPELAAVGYYLHGFYTGIESIVERIVDRLGESKPTGPTWHTGLLDQITEPVTGLRPPVIDLSLRQRLEDYRKFRHFFRHAYSVPLEWSQMEAEAAGAADILAELRAQLTVFFDQLLAADYKSAASQRRIPNPAGANSERD